MSQPFPPPAAYADLIRLAVAEDLGDAGDVTSLLTVPADLDGVATVYQKQAGVVAGLPIVLAVCAAFDPQLRVELLADEGSYDAGAPKRAVARVRGPMRSLLAAERTMLNFLQRLGGVATLTRRYVELARGTEAQILDTRKTLPGWRALDKYAVRAGGGQNHRTGLFDMVLVKDNHVAQLGGTWAERLATFVARSRRERPTLPIEVEVDTLAQFEQVLRMTGVDVVLLDNLGVDAMRGCVAARDAAGLRGRVQLEASGGINLQTVRAIAETGVDRISVGALTHSAPALDLSLDLEPV